MERGIIRFCRSLQDQRVGPNVHNFYAAKRTNKQRHNLQTYLHYVFEHNHQILFVGEAPGYNGCARTGIPFSSEQLLQDGVLNGKLFGEANGYYVSEKRARQEQTAAAMWQILQQHGTVPLLWNAYPFHPHKEGDRNSNRQPTAKELKLGSRYLLELIALFEVQKVVAVGNSAEIALSRIGVEYIKVRHPSYGGKKQFSHEMEMILRGE